MKWIDSRFGRISILYEDDAIIVVDKPPRLLTVATERDDSETLYRHINHHLRRKRRPDRIFIVHRLDRDTSGVILFAKSFTVKKTLQDSWDTIVDNKQYSAVVEGCVRDDEKTLRSYLAEDRFCRVFITRDPLKGKEAITHFRCVRRSDRYSLLDVNIDTGRKNQIRVQLAGIGHPVAGDKKYGATTDPLRRLCLHAAELAFIHPVSGKHMMIASAVPQAFVQLVQ